MVHNRAQAAMGQEMGQEMTRSRGIPDSALGTEMGSLGSSRTAGLGTRAGDPSEVGVGYLEGHCWGHEGSIGSSWPSWLLLGCSLRCFCYGLHWRGWGVAPGGRPAPC